MHLHVTLMPISFSFSADFRCSMLPSWWKSGYISSWRRVTLNSWHEQYGLLQHVRLPELWSWILWPQPRQISPHSMLYYWQISLLLFKIWNPISLNISTDNGSHNSASGRNSREEFCIILLNYLYKTTHQLLRSKHKQLMGLVGCFLFIVQPSPISCFTNYFKFIGTSIKLTIYEWPSQLHSFLLRLMCILYWASISGSESLLYSHIMLVQRTFCSVTHRTQKPGNRKIQRKYSSMRFSNMLIEFFLIIYRSRNL